MEDMEEGITEAEDEATGVGGICSVPYAYCR